MVRLRGAANLKVALHIQDTSEWVRYLELRGDATVESDDDYVFANRLGAKYGAVDLRNMDRPGERRTGGDDQPDPGASRRHAPARQRRVIAEAVTAVEG